MIMAIIMITRMRRILVITLGLKLSVLTLDAPGQDQIQRSSLCHCMDATFKYSVNMSNCE